MPDSPWHTRDCHGAHAILKCFGCLANVGSALASVSASPGDRYHPVSMGAFHSDDIEYVFGTLDSRPGMSIRPEDRALSELMQQYWTNFAKSGDPNGPGLPKWPTYNATAGYPVMRLDATPAASPDTLRPRYLFLDSVWASSASK